MGACGGGGGDTTGTNGGGGGGTPTPAPVTRTVGGTVSGLTGSVVLQNNAGNNLTVSTNGGFTFFAPINTGATYVVTVLTQPAGQNCTVASGSGTANADVTNVAVTCAASAGTTTTATIGGGITGMSSAGMVLTLSRNGAVVETLPAMTANAVSFAFTTQLSTGNTWAVAVATQPSSPNQNCVVSGGSGTIAAASVSGVQITCTTITVSISGTVSMASGTLAAGLVLQENGGDDLAVPAGAATTNFTFATPQTLPSNFSVTIKAQPAGQTCAVAKGLGAVALLQAGTASILIQCVNLRTVNTLNGTYDVRANGTLLPAYFTFFSDGTYLFGLRSDNASCGPKNGNGVELGVYDFNAALQTLTIVNAVVDTNGGCGMQDTVQAPRVITAAVKNGSTGVLTGTLPDAPNPSIPLTLTPVSSTTGQLLGAWTSAGRLNFTVYKSDNTFFLANAQPFQGVSTSIADAGIEDACFAGAAPTSSSGSYTVNFTNTCTTAGKAALDTNGTANGLSGVGANAVNFTVTGDSMTNTVGGNTPATVQRILTN